MLVGDDPASRRLHPPKHKAAREAGIEARDVRLPATTSEDEMLALVAELNADDAVDGILVQLPLPAHIDEARVCARSTPRKDVDGFHPVNAGQLYLGRPTLVPATPLGIMALLAEYERPARRRARRRGRPQRTSSASRSRTCSCQANATVTFCHSRTGTSRGTRSTPTCSSSPSGSPAIVTADMVKAGAAVVDVGINRTERARRRRRPGRGRGGAAFLTPVPGGVGPMTIAMLLRNTVAAARYRRGSLAFPVR